MMIGSPQRIWVEAGVKYVRSDLVAALEAENERLRKDAERYRALRDGSLDDLAVVRGLGVIDYGLNVMLYTYLKEIDGDELDNAIDATLSPAPEAQQEAVVVSVADINAWRSEWLDANDPQDGTDCVTPFDKYLYTRPSEQAVTEASDDYVFE